MTGLAQDSLGLQDLDQRLQQLEAKEEKRQTLINITLKEKQLELKESILLFLGGSTALGLIAAFFIVPNYIKKRTQEEVDKQLADILSGRQTEVRRMLNHYNEENILLREKRILIWDGGDAEVVMMMGLMMVLMRLALTTIVAWQRPKRWCGRNVDVRRV